MRAQNGGLSLERFIRAKDGALHQKKLTAAKKVFIEKCQRKRKYAKEVKKEQASLETTADGVGSKRFYDKFFAELKQNDASADKPKKQRYASAGERKTRPDPFFKAKQKAAEIQTQRNARKVDIMKKKEEYEKIIQQRKRRHAKLSARTATGQPFMRNSVKDILNRLQSSSSRSS